MTYPVFISKSAQKSLDRLPFLMREKISKAILNLSSVSRPPNCKKLTGREAWRIRVGDYRVIYEIQENRLVILVVVVGHRKEVYR